MTRKQPRGSRLDACSLVAERQGGTRRPDVVTCEICGYRGGTLHRAREMMFGSRKEFSYQECHGCGCLSLLDVPLDLSPYYPEGYYSMEKPRTNALRKVRDRLYLSALFSPLVNWRHRSDLDAIRRCGLRKDQRLLDVGCGAGRLIYDLRQLGYRAEGIDAFIGADARDQSGVRVRKIGISEVRDRYELILFRHSLEHMPDQIGTLAAARDRLAPGGTLVVCIPVIGWAWRHYGVCWSQLDAPRHLFLHTVNSFRLAAGKARLRVERIVYDSDDFQFWGSELYRQDKPLHGSRRPGRLEMMRMRRRAAQLNRRRDGDKVQFYLRAV